MLPFGRLSARRQPDHHARARRHIVLLGVICGGLGLVCLFMLGPALRVLTAYRPPETGRTIAAPIRNPHAERVVLVVVSHLATDTMSDRGDPWRLVELRRRAAEGARGTVRAVQPSGDAPTWAALLSGAGPQQSGIVDDAAGGPLPIPTLFDQAAIPGLPTAVVAGPAAWKARSGLAMPDQLVTARSNATAGTAAVDLLRAGTEQLVVVLLDASRGPAIRLDEIAARVDSQIGAIAAVLNPARDTLIVTGDHGVLPDGSSGGHERTVLDVPLVLWGRAVAPGELGPVDQRDIAPTVAALLGLPYSGAGGQPLLDALDLDDEMRAREMVALLDARVAVPAADASTSARMESTRLLRASRDSLGKGDWARARAEAEQGLSALILPEAPPRYVSSTWAWGAGLPL
ncbi:MAG: hypothetical protein M3380_11825, partial [Chloroflexota bacterium]|nr:hypothetical protein [Chloroflexota bacterium]